MAETVGTLIDKLTIVELRRWHTEEAMLNPAAEVGVRHTAALRLRVIDEQRSDLAAELDALWTEIAAGRVKPKIYRQLKLYNDAAMRRASGGAAAVVDAPTPAPAPTPATVTRMPVRALPKSTR
jgi:Protein of unknown function (DUF4254)